MEKYIPKSAVVAEIEKKIRQYEMAFDNPSFASYEASLIAKGKYRKLLDILHFIDTLEVKEMDLEEEIDSIWNPHFNLGWDDKSLLSINHGGFASIAKHFFELGLKAKGE